MKGNTISKGIKHSDETKALHSKIMKGNTYRLGHKHSKETKDKISKTLKSLTPEQRNIPILKGKDNSFFGKKHSDEAKRKIALARTGTTRSVGTKLKISGPNSPNWKGGISFEPYCLKFNNTFKELIRDKFNRKCFLCDISELEQMEDQMRRSKKPYRLSIHHVSYNKNCLCDDIDCEFIPLCSSCHSKTTIGDRAYWENHIIKLLTERREIE